MRVGCFFSLFLLIAGCGVTFGAESRGAISWHIIDVEHGRIHYAKGFTKDAKLMAKLWGEAVRALETEFQDQNPEALMEGVTVKVYLHPKPVEMANAHTTTLTGEYAKGRAELHYLSPSLYTDQDRGAAGEPMNNPDYHKQILVHELSTIYLERITAAKGGGWRFLRSPNWFIQGYEEYLRLKLTSEYTRTTLQERYFLKYLESGGIELDNTQFVVRDSYRNGQVLVRFMHEEFGVDKIHELLLNRKASFWAAVEEALGVTPSGLYQRFEAWKDSKYKR